MESYEATEKKISQAVVAIWMGLKSIMQSKVNQRRRKIQDALPHLWYLVKPLKIWKIAVSQNPQILDHRPERVKDCQ